MELDATGAGLPSTESAAEPDEVCQAEVALPPAPPPAPPQLTDDETQLLRAFDLNLNYGPCCGPTRLERWERAARLGLQPPSQVHTLLLGRGDDDPANQSMLTAYGL